MFYMNFNRRESVDCATAPLVEKVTWKWCHDSNNLQRYLEIWEFSSITLYTSAWLQTDSGLVVWLTVRLLPTCRHQLWAHPWAQGWACVSCQGPGGRCRRSWWGWRGQVGEGYWALYGANHLGAPDQSRQSWCWWRGGWWGWFSACDNNGNSIIKFNLYCPPLGLPVLFRN